MKKLCPYGTAVRLHAPDVPVQTLHKCTSMENFPDVAALAFKKIVWKDRLSAYVGRCRVSAFTQMRG